MDDTEILSLYESRSQNAIRETEKKYGAYCRAISLNILQNREDAEECVNDVYQKAWECIPPAHPENLCAFLGRLARNLALDRFRLNHAKKRGGGQYDAVLSELEECLPGPNNAEQLAEQLVIRAVLNRFLADLPAEKRRIFLRRYWYFSPLAEIARDFHCSESRIQSILHRLRIKLKEQLEAEGVDL